ncbi:MAG: hypothetical protein Fur005_26460 [Roseiflexaceae bacterium]
MQLDTLYRYDGPNRYGPQPGAFLRAHAATKQANALRAHLKDVAQRVGIVLGYIDATDRPDPPGWQVEVQCVSPTPNLAAEALLLAMAICNGQDEEVTDQAIWALQRRRRSEALPIELLQIQAEAHTRQIPSFVRPDQQLQLGYGIRSQAIPIRRKADGDLMPVEAIGVAGMVEKAAPPQPAWDQLGTIPIIAISGVGAAAAAATIAQQRPMPIVGGDLQRIRSTLSDPQLPALIALPEITAMAAQGLAFEVCSACVLLAPPSSDDPTISTIAETDETALIVGLPLLVTVPHGVAVLPADIPAIAALSEYTPCPIVWYAEQREAVLPAAGHGIAVVYAEGNAIMALVGGQQRLLGHFTATRDRHGQLAAMAALLGMDMQGM